MPVYVLLNSCWKQKTKTSRKTEEIYSFIVNTHIFTHRIAYTLSHRALEGSLVFSVAMQR